MNAYIYVVSRTCLAGVEETFATTAAAALSHHIESQLKPNDPATLSLVNTHDTALRTYSLSYEYIFAAGNEHMAQQPPPLPIFHLN